MWKNNNFFVGFTVAISLIVITLFLLVILVPVIFNLFELGQADPRLLLLSVIPPIIMMRYYMKTLQFGKSGRGALIVIFLSILLYFVLVAGKINNFPTF